jgi:hypothetical protein
VSHASLVSVVLIMAQCLATGRPPTLCDPALTDCGFPFSEATEHDVDGPKLATDVVVFQHARDMTVQVVMLTSMIAPPQYQEILALDATIRAAWVSYRDIDSLIGVGHSALARAAMLNPHRAASEHFAADPHVSVLTLNTSTAESPSRPFCASCGGVPIGSNSKPVPRVVLDSGTFCLGDCGMDAWFLQYRPGQGRIRASAFVDMGYDSCGACPFIFRCLCEFNYPAVDAVHYH